MRTVAGWEHKSLTDLAEYINGRAFKPDDWGDEGLPIIRIEQLKNPSTVSDYYAGKLPSENIIEDGDLIFSWSASLFLRIWTHGNAALNQHLFKVIEKEGVDRIFLKSFIEFYLPELTKASHGSTMQHITRKELEKFSSLFPVAIEEQAQIGSILFTLDRAIKQTEAIIAKQQRIKSGLMQDLLTKGVDEHGAIRSEATHSFKDSPLGRIPVEWEVTNFGNIISKHGGKIQTGPFGSQLHAYEYVDEGIPVVMPQDISPPEVLTTKIARITEGKANQLLRHRMLPGDLIFARRGDLSRCAWITEQQQGWICGTGCLLMRPPSNVLSPKWTSEVYRFHTTQVQVDVQAVGSTMPNLNTGILSALLISLPTYEEQVRIEEYLQAAEEYQNRMIAQLSKLLLTKTGLMYDLLTGTVRVSNTTN